MKKNVVLTAEVPVEVDPEAGMTAVVAKMETAKERVDEIAIETKAMFEQGELDLRTAQLYIGAAFYNVEAMRLYRTDGFKSMKDFYAGHGMSEDTGRRLLRIGRGIAEIMQSVTEGFDGIITRKHVRMLKQACVTGQDVIMKIPLLLTDGQLQKVDEDMNEFQTVAGSLVKDKYEKDAAERLKKKKTSYAKESYKVLMPMLREALTDVARLAMDIWHNYKGVTAADLPEAVYLTALTHWYATHTPRTKNDPVWQFISYTDAQEMLADGTLDEAKRPDVAFAINAAMGE